MRFFIAILACCIIAGCSSAEKPENLLPEDTYIDLLIELQLLTSFQKQQRPDSTTADSLREVIFDKYKTTRSRFRKSHEYYQQDIEAQTDRIEKTIERLRKDRISALDSTTTADSTKADSTRAN